MSITIERYNDLVRYAKKICLYTYINPYDIVHDAIAANPDCTHKEVKGFLYKQQERLGRETTYREQTGKKKRTVVKTSMCYRCREPLPESAFKTRANGKIYSYCRPCDASHQRECRQKRIEDSRSKARKYYHDHKDKLLPKVKQYYKENKEARKKAIMRWVKANPAKRKAACKRYYQKKKAAMEKV